MHEMMNISYTFPPITRERMIAQRQIWFQKLEPDKTLLQDPPSNLFPIPGMQLQTEVLDNSAR